MRAGLLRYPIIIQEPVSIQDSFGANSIEWNNIINTRAQITYNSGNRLNQNNEIITTYTITFTIRLYHNINEKMRIFHNGKYYRILSINKDIYNQSTTIITELIND